MILSAILFAATCVLLPALPKSRACIAPASAAVFKEMDYFTPLLPTGLFIVISGITRAGIVDAIRGFFVKVSGSNLFAIYALLVRASAPPFCISACHRRHAGREPDAHRRLRQHHRAGHPAQGGL